MPNNGQQRDDFVAFQCCGDGVDELKILRGGGSRISDSKTTTSIIPQAGWKIIEM